MATEIVYVEVVSRNGFDVVPEFVDFNFPVTTVEVVN